MADEKIELNLEIKARGASGVTTEVKKIVGTVNDLSDSLTQLAKPTAGFGNVARKQFKQIRDALVQLQAEALRTGKSLEQINATGVGTKKSRIRAVVGGDGAELAANKAAASAQKEQLRERKRLAAELVQFQERFERQEQKRRTAEAREEQQAVAARVRQAQARITARQREKAQEERLKKQTEIASGRKAGALTATAGFLGLNLAQQLDGALDGIKAKGLIAPVLADIFGAFGDLFGSTIGQIFAKIATGIGKLLESIFDIIGAGFRAGIKFISGLLTGISTALITVLTTGVSGILLGVIGGLFIGLLKAATSLLQDLFAVVGNVLSAIGNLISAVFQVIKTVFDSFVSIVKGIWDSFWSGLKAVAELSMEAIAEITKTVLNQLTEGFLDFVASEKLATKSFVNISDEVGKGYKTFQEGAEATRKLGNEMRRTFAVGSEDSQGAIFDILSGGFEKLADAQTILASAGKLATIGQDTLKDSASSVATVLLSYGKGASEANDVAATLNSISKAGRFDLGGLSKALPNVINSAASAKVPLNELGAALAAITLTGVPVQEAATGINRLLLAMISPTRQNKKAFTELGLEFTRTGSDGKIVAKSFSEIVQEFKKIPDDKVRKVFGSSEGIRAFRALSNNAGKFQETLTKINSGTKLFGKDFEDSSGTFAFIFEKVKQIGLTIRENIGGAFGELIRGPLKLIVPLIQRIGEVMDSEKVTKFFKAFQTYAQPIVDSAITPIITGLKGILSYLETGDFVGLFKTEGALNFRKEILNIIDIVKKLPKALDETFGIFKALEPLARSIFKDIIMPTLEFLGDPKNVNAFIEGLAVAVGYAKEIKDAVMEAFNNPDALVQFFNNLLTAAGNSIVAVGTFLVEVLKKAFVIVSNFLQASIVGSLVNGVKEGLKTATDVIAKGLDSQREAAAERINKRTQNFNPITATEDEAANATDYGIINATSGLGNVFKGISGSLAPNRLQNDEIQKNNTFKTVGNFYRNGGELGEGTPNRISGSSGIDKDTVDSFFRLLIDEIDIGSAREKSGDPKNFDKFLDVLAASLQNGPGQLKGGTVGSDTIGTQIRVGSEQQRSLDSLNASVPDFLPAVKQDFGTMITELQQINKNTLNFKGDKSPVVSPISEAIKEAAKPIVPELTDTQIANKERYGITDPFKSQGTSTIAKGLDFEYKRRDKGANNEKTIEKLLAELLKVNEKIEAHAAKKTSALNTSSLNDILSSGLKVDTKNPPADLWEIQ